MNGTLDQIQEFFFGALKKALLEENSVKPFLNSILGVLSTLIEEDTLQGYLNQDLSDETNLIGKALITLRMMIDMVPPDQRVIPLTVEFVESAICNWSAGPRRGACLAIGVVASTEKADKECLNRLLGHLAVVIKDYHPAATQPYLRCIAFFLTLKSV